MDDDTLTQADKENLINDLWEYEYRFMTNEDLILLAKGAFFGIHDNKTYEEILEKHSKTIGV